MNDTDRTPYPERLRVRVTRRQMDAIRARAAADHRTVSEWVRELVWQALEESRIEEGR